VAPPPSLSLLSLLSPSLPSSLPRFPSPIKHSFS
jgi:hypothetical protein